MKDGQENKISTKDTKLKTTFTVFVMFVLMAAVAVVFLGIEIPQGQQSSLQEKQQESDIASSASTLPTSQLTELVEELENQGSLFLEKTTESQGEESEFNYLTEMTCNQLSDIASSFEDGWGKAVAEYNSRCKNDK